MTTIEVADDPSRPMILHLKGERSIVLQLTAERLPIEVESARAKNRTVCVHRLFRFFKGTFAEAVCERDDVKFVAMQKVTHAH